MMARQVLRCVACFRIPRPEAQETSFTPGGLSISRIDQSNSCALRASEQDKPLCQARTPRPRQHMHARANPVGQHAGRTRVCAAQ